MENQADDKTKIKCLNLSFLNLKDSLRHDLSCSVVTDLKIVIIIHLIVNISVRSYSVTEHKRDMIETLHGSVQLTGLHGFVCVCLGMITMCI